MAYKPRLVLVEWHDSRGCSANWQRAKDVIHDGICKMRSVGWLLVDNDKEICIVPHMGLEEDDDDQVCGEMHIPMTCIEQIIGLDTQPLTQNKPDNSYSVMPLREGWGVHKGNKEVPEWQCSTQKKAIGKAINAARKGRLASDKAIAWPVYKHGNDGRLEEVETA